MPKNLLLQSEVYAVGDDFRGQVIVIDRDKNQFNPVPLFVTGIYDDEDIPHILCRNWGLKKGLTVVRATDQD